MAFRCKALGILLVALLLCSPELNDSSKIHTDYPANLTLERCHEEMPIDKNQLRRLIREVLSAVDLWSPEAEELLMLTSATESHLGTYLFQKSGPAVGIFQVELNTYRDILNNYLVYHKDLRTKIEGVVKSPLEDANTLRYNLAAQIIFARLVYLRAPTPIPKDLGSMAKYYKKHFNTPLGRATPEMAIADYKRLVDEG